MIVPLGIGFGLVVFVLILVLLLRRRLREKYALLWLLIGLAILVLAVFPGLLVGLARLLGVAVPSNLLFALALALLIGVTLHLSWELSTAEEEIRRVAEEVAILRAEMDELHGRLRMRTDESASTDRGDAGAPRGPDSAGEASPGRPGRDDRSG